MTFDLLSIIIGTIGSKWYTEHRLLNLLFWR